jgi:putative ABC transport system permease protein
VQKNYGYEIIVGPPKGSPLQLVLNTVYQIDQSPGNIPYSVYEDLLKNRFNVRIAVPYAVGDSYKGHRIIGTATKLFGFDDAGQPLPPERVLEYQIGKRYELAEGRVFHPQKFQAIIGSDVARQTDLKVGSKFKATHGLPQPGQEEDEHDQEWEVVGVLKPTPTAADRVIYIPLVSFYAISEHEEALEQQARLKAGLPPLPPKSAKPQTATQDAHDEHDHQFHLNPDGTINLELPKEDWVLSAVLVKARGAFQASSLMYHYKLIDPNALAVSPAEVMRQFFDTFLRGSTLVLLCVSVLVIIVAAVGILVAIYNSVSARMREIAILRALGATRRRILAIICLEAGLVGSIGAAIGLILGHAIAAGGSVYLNRILGQGIHWHRIDQLELYGLLGVVALAVLAGLVPALKAYRTPVATNLVAG